MNIKGQLNKLFTVLYMSSVVFGAAVEISPTTIPAGATNANYFYQVLTITFSDNGSGAWADGEDVVVNFPATIQLADTDGALYSDEVAISVSSAANLSATVDATTSASSIVINIANANAADEVASGDKMQLVFPIATTAGSTGSVNYTILYGGGDEEVGGGSATVTFTASAISSATLGAAYTGGDDATSGTGNYYPAQLRATTSLLVKALPNDDDEFALDDGPGAVITFIIKDDVTTANGSEDGAEKIIVGTQGLTTTAAVATQIATVINVVTGFGQSPNQTLNTTASISPYNTSAVSLEQDVAGTAGNTTPTSSAAARIGVVAFAGGASSAITAALPVVITDFAAGGGGAQNVAGNIFTPNNTDTDEPAYELRASKTAGLLKAGTADNAFAVVDLHFNNPITAGSRHQDVEGGTFAERQFDLESDQVTNSTWASGAGEGADFTAGIWYLYVVNPSLSKDWVLGTSGTVTVKKPPVFKVPLAVEESVIYTAGVDFDADASFETANSSHDDVALLAVDSNQEAATGFVNAAQPGNAVVATTGVLRSTGDGLLSRDNGKFHYNLEDLDEDCPVEIWISDQDNKVVGDLTVTGEAGSEAVTLGFGAGTTTQKLNSGALAESDGAAGFTYDIFTDASTYSAYEGSWYVYVMANDGDDQALYQLKNSAGADFKFEISHYPFFKFNTAAASATTFNTSLDEYLAINWGVDGVHGDFDLDDDADIDLWMCTGDYAAVVNAGGGPKFAPTTATCVPVADNIKENGDTQANNRYMWNVRSATISPDTYYLYAHLNDGVNDLTVQYKSDGKLVSGVDDDITFVISDGASFYPLNPIAGQTQSIGGQDEYEFRWTAFDKSATQYGTVTFSGAGANNDVITITDAAGTVRAYTGLTAGSGNGSIIGGIATDIEYEIGGSAAATATALAAAINHSNGHGAALSAVVATAAVNITDANVPSDESDGSIVETTDGSGHFAVVDFSTNDDIAIFMSQTGGLVLTYTAANAASTAGYHWLTSTNGQAPALQNDIGSDGKYVVDFSTITNDWNDATPPAVGNYFVYYYFITDGVADSETPYQADGYLSHTGDAGTALAKGYELKPNVAFISGSDESGQGDAIDFDVHAHNGATGGGNGEIYSFSINASALAFDVADKDGGTAGVQPFTVADVFGGDHVVTMNSLVTADDNHSLRYVVYDANASQNLNGSVSIGSFTLTARNDDTASEPVSFEVTAGSIYRSRIVLADETDLADLEARNATVNMVTRGSISGEVNLEGRASGSAQTVTITLSSTGSYDEIADSVFNAENANTETLDANGMFTITHVPSGLYKLVISNQGWLSQVYDNVKVGSNQTTYVHFSDAANTLKAGDVTGYNDGTSDLPDNKVEVADALAIANTYFGKATGDAGFQSFADFDGDGTIYVEELNLSVKNANTDGEGLLYKSIDSDNNEAMIALNKVESSNDRVVYTVSASRISALRAYAVEMDIDANDWDMISRVDHLKANGQAIEFDKSNGHKVTSVSALIGYGSVPMANQDLVTIVLQPLVNDPIEPVITEATLIDDQNRSVKAVISNNGLVMPNEYILSQNFPNPFNPVTNIAFAIPQDGLVKLMIYDLMGREVRELVSSRLSGGNYSANWNATNTFGNRVSSGLYFYSLTVDNKMIATQKMILMK